MELLQAIKERRTIRKFKPDPVPRELLEKIIKNSMWAPSAMNTQPWKFYVFTEDARQGLISVAEGCLDQLDSRMEKMFDGAMRNMIRGYFKDFGGAPAIVVVVSHLPAEAVYQKASLYAACAAMQNLMLLAHEAGLGTCWMMGPLWVEADIINYLNCPGWGLVGITPVGWPEHTPPAPPRKDELIEWRD